MGPAEIREYCPIDEAGRSLLKAAMQQLAMSARAFYRVLKLARTIADLTGSERAHVGFRVKPGIIRFLRKAEPACIFHRRQTFAI